MIAEPICPVCGGVVGPMTDAEETGGTTTHSVCLSGVDRGRAVPVSAAEHDALREIVSTGRAPCRVGYPDLWWLEGDRLCFAEAKANRLEPFTREQAAFSVAARRQGCRFFRYDPGQGLVELPPAGPAKGGDVRG